MKYIKKYEDIDWEFDEDETDIIHSDFIGYENLYKFLVNNKALDKYIKNYNKYKLLNNPNNLKDFLDYNNKYQYIIKSFYWDETPEGAEFWNGIDNKWRYINKKYNENIEWEFDDEEMEKHDLNIKEGNKKYIFLNNTSYEKIEKLVHILNDNNVIWGGSRENFSDIKKNVKKIIKNTNYNFNTLIIKNIKGRYFVYFTRTYRDIENLFYLDKIIKENINWEFDEEEDGYLGYPIYLNELSREEYENLLKELKVGEMFNFTFKKDNKVYNSDGTIRYVGEGRVGEIIGVEFDEYIRGHNGKDIFDGKDGYCWFFNNKLMNYGLIINKRI